MKSLITTLIAAALSLPGAMSSASQEPPGAPPPVAPPVADADEQQLATALAAVQKQVEVELRPKLEAAAADAGAKLEAAQRQIEQQLAKAKEAIALAQAAPAAVKALPAASAAVATQQRLHQIVGRPHGGPGKALVIRTSDTDVKSQAKLEEDLAVMSRILDKKLAQLEGDKPRRAMGIDVFFAPGSGSIRNLYLEGYGALFLVSVNYPLLPPPEKPETTKEKSEIDTTWDDAKDELYGRADTWSHLGNAFKFSMAGGPPEEYNESKVNELKDGLLEALKNATNIRNLKPDETITVCVFGGASAATAKLKRDAKRTTAVAGEDGDKVSVVEGADGTPARATILTIRVKKSDVDAFAKGKLNLDEFRKKAGIAAYTGDTGGWTGGWGGGGAGGWGGGGGVFGLVSP